MRSAFGVQKLFGWIAGLFGGTKAREESTVGNGYGSQ